MSNKRSGSEYYLACAISSNNTKLSLLDDSIIAANNDWLYEYESLTKEISYLIGIGDMDNADKRKYRSVLSKFTRKIDKLSKGV